MDVQFDISSIYFGLRALKVLEDNFIGLCTAMNSVQVNSSLLSSSSLYEPARVEINNVTNSTIHNLITLLENSKNILERYDREAALLFKYYEQGILTEDGHWTAVPLMNQDDYGDIRYSQGTVASSGCGITSLCMLASYITNNLYTPDDLAAIANANGTSNVDRMTFAADLVGLNWTNDRNTSREDLVNYLKDGKMVICLVKNSSHFVLCTGLTDDGQITVNDPYSPFRKQSHQDGYDWSELQFSAGNTWVFDPASNTGSNVVDDKVTVSQEVLNKLAEQGIDLNAMNDVVPKEAPAPTPLSAPETTVPEQKPTSAPVPTTEQQPTTPSGNTNSGSTTKPATPPTEQKPSTGTSGNTSGNTGNGTQPQQPTTPSGNPNSGTNPGTPAQQPSPAPSQDIPTTEPTPAAPQTPQPVEQPDVSTQVEPPSSPISTQDKPITDQVPNTPQQPVVEQPDVSTQVEPPSPTIEETPKDIEIPIDYKEETISQPRIDGIPIKPQIETNPNNNQISSYSNPNPYPKQDSYIESTSIPTSTTINEEDTTTSLITDDYTNQGLENVDYDITYRVGGSSLADRNEETLYPTFMDEQHNIEDITSQTTNNTSSSVKKTEFNNSWIPSTIGIATVATAGLATATYLDKKDKEKEKQNKI